ncbi:MAG: hypothetical protein OXG37_04610 [Actinomycetia bacterium]|nr:hypothetical protein [Actinomycetes bacterium]
MTRGGKRRQRQRDLPSGNQPRRARSRRFAVALAVWWVLAAPAAVAAETTPGQEELGEELAASSVVWEDPVGDGNVGPPDIRTVTVSNTDDGVVTVSVEIPGTPVLPDSLRVHVFFDVDESSQTGDSTRRHAEYAVQVNGETSMATLYRWDEPAWRWREVASTVEFWWENGPTITLDVREIGFPPGFNLAVLAEQGDYQDSAPDLWPLWGYRIVASGPRAPVWVPPEQWRPTLGGTYAYELPSEAFAGERAVVHYVPIGGDRPPWGDRDSDGVPDYVETAAEAADVALARFEQLGFKTPALDIGGPDERPDIYLKNLDSHRIAGRAFSHRIWNGGFAIIDSRLGDDFLRTTVAHEVFHLIQHAYLPRGMPCWVTEGTAAAAETFVFPGINEPLRRKQLGRWLAEPSRPLNDGSASDLEFCYATAAWWRALHDRDPGLLPAYFAELARTSSTDAGGLRLNAIAETRGLGPLGGVYAAFAESIYRDNHKPHRFHRVNARKQQRTTRVFPLAPLGAHYLPVRTRGPARILELTVETVEGPDPRVRLVLGGPGGRTVTAPVWRSAQAITVQLRNPTERRAIMLIVTGNHQHPTSYRITHKTR